MLLRIHYKNCRRSEWIEDQLKSNLATIEPILPRGSNAVVNSEISKEADGSTRVSISMKSPKIFATYVDATQEVLTGAMHAAIERFKRVIIKRKERIKTRSRKSPDPFEARMDQEESMEGIDASNILKFEPARRKRMTEEKKRKDLASAPVAKIAFLKSISGIGGKRQETLLTAFPANTLDDLAVAARTKQLRYLPGIGRRLEALVRQRLSNHIVSSKKHSTPNNPVYPPYSMIH